MSFVFCWPHRALWSLSCRWKERARSFASEGVAPLVCPCLVCAVTRELSSSSAQKSCVLSASVCVLTCSVPRLAQHLAGWGIWPVVWIQAVRWHNRERRGRASWWSETVGVLEFRDDPSEKHTREEGYTLVAHFTTATAGEDSLPFCLLMMKNPRISQISSWSFWERLTRRHITVQQTNLQQGFQESGAPCSLSGFRWKINRSRRCQEGTLGHFWEWETGRLIVAHLPNLQERFEETDGHFGSTKKD